MKRPAFQFYPGDWRKDSSLQSCSIAARGLWIELICIMHECDRYGVLAINGRPMQPVQIARLVGENEEVVRGLLEELEAAGVFSRDESGAIYSRRMIRDENLRAVRAAGGEAGKLFGQLGAAHGKKGGRPRKETGVKKPPLKPPLTAPLKPPPSSSSSSSFSSSPIGDDVPPPNPPQGAGGGAHPLPDWLSPADWQAFIEHRKRLRSPMTDLAQTKAIAELDRLRADGHDPVQVINQSIINGWKGLFPLKQRTIGAHVRAAHNQEEPRDVVSRI